MPTPHKGWIPENCIEIDNEWYFLVDWQDCPGGWKSLHKGKTFFYPFDGPPCEVNQQLMLFKK